MNENTSYVVTRYMLKNINTKTKSKYIQVSRLVSNRDKSHEQIFNLKSWQYFSFKIFASFDEFILHNFNWCWAIADNVERSRVKLSSDDERSWRVRRTTMSDRDECVERRWMIVTNASSEIERSWEMSRETMNHCDESVEWRWAIMSENLEWWWMIVTNASKSDERVSRMMSNDSSM